ncbi:MAG TPA: hypothetical protein VH277_18760 [Gemmatimonadaceae bacterium]|jgi:hypothetical protein|nr:hypothetical protein [Gemmatimonadaceae bacterium]
MRLKSLIAAISAAVIGASSAQDLGAQAPISSQSSVRIPSTTYIGFNPIGLPLDIGTLEVESGVAPGVTLGGVASYIDVSDNRFTTFDFKARYYPTGIVLRGTAIGATFGYTRFSNQVSTSSGDERRSLNAATLGIVLDYNWIYGFDQHFLIGTGVGAKRVLASASARDSANVDRAVVTARLIIGFAF